MSAPIQSSPSWCDAEAAVSATEGCPSTLDSNKIHVLMMSADKREAGNRDSGCDLSSAGTDSPSSYRWIKDDNSTGSYSCSSCEATVDQTSNVYHQLAQTLAQARLKVSDTKDPLFIPPTLTVSESSIALNPIITADSRGEENLAMGELNEKNNLERLSDLPEMPSFPDASFKTEPQSRKSRGRLFPQVLASLALAIAALIEGYSSGYTSPALASMTQADSSIPVNDQQVSQNHMIKRRIFF